MSCNSQMPEAPDDQSETNGKNKRHRSDVLPGQCEEEREQRKRATN